MATRGAHKRLAREYQNISVNPPPYITAHPSENNILEWHYILTGPPNTPYTDGQYWGTLVFPPDYPFAPPAIRMHTPSGRFQTSTRLCLSISDFHPKSFNPAWEVSTILLGLQSFMNSDEMTTGSIGGTETERKVFASKSRWWNSTGGGSSSRTVSGVNIGKGNGAIKAGDGGKKFRDEWKEVDEENWKWMEKNKVDPTNGRMIVINPSSTATEGQSTVGSTVGGTTLAPAVPNGQVDAQGWLARHKWHVVFVGLFAYVVMARLIGDTTEIPS